MFVKIIQYAFYLKMHRESQSQAVEQIQDLFENMYIFSFSFRDNYIFVLLSSYHIRYHIIIIYILLYYIVFFIRLSSAGKDNTLTPEKSARL